MKINKYLLFIFFAGALFLRAGLVHALEVQYPVLTAIGLPNINQGATLPQFVEYFFGLGVYVVGLIATLSFAVGAIELMLSGGSSGLETEAKDRMKGAIIGVIIAVLAILILNIINPNIANEKLNPLPTPSPTQVYEQPGVYFCTGGCDGTKCKGTMSSVMTSDQDPIDPNFTGQINGVRFVNDPSNNIKYGVILHDNSLGSTGLCTLPIYNTSTSSGATDCETVSSSINATAANIFAIGNNSAGNGVNFYSKFGGSSNNTNGGAGPHPNDGISKVLANQINPVFIGNANAMKYDYTTSSVSDIEQKVVLTVQDQLGSIEIDSNGGYLVAVYSGATSSSSGSTGSSTGSTYCRTLTASDWNTNAPSIAGPNASQLSSIYIFSTE